MRLVRSAALGLLSSFDTLAHHTDQLGVKAAIHAERNAAEDPSEYKQAETPNPSHTSWNLLGEVVCLPPANWTQQTSSWNVTLIGIVALIGVKALASVESLICVVALVVSLTIWWMRLRGRRGYDRAKSTLLVLIRRLVALIVALWLISWILVEEKGLIGDLGVRVCLVTHSDMINI